MSQSQITNHNNHSNSSSNSSSSNHSNSNSNSNSSNSNSSNSNSSNSNSSNSNSSNSSNNSSNSNSNTMTGLPNNTERTAIVDELDNSIYVAGAASVNVDPESGLPCSNGNTSAAHACAIVAATKCMQQEEDVEVVRNKHADTSIDNGAPTTKTTPRRLRPTRFYRICALVIGLLLVAAAAALAYIALEHEGFVWPTNQHQPKSVIEEDDAPTFTTQQLELHDSYRDCWLAIHGTVYDLTAFASKHEGGEFFISSRCGTDATQSFQVHHAKSTLKTAVQYEIGLLVEAPAAADGVE